MARLGAFLKSAFGRPKPDGEALAQVKAWCRAALPEASYAVNEIACTDPGCPGIETVILVMEPGRKTRAVKVQKPLDEVSEQDVREAFKA
ncbi:hypothetical protein [Microvirga pudoricolor]|uniref:hypothetical protein n=1 Tax=Microvirga pudoricolor TaxID=2778729 RepID=UPI00195161E1|nr:hypothetical protein [Microvirga pudoricolor]MBM6594891.1 hypothetical protein [Microvirga pudoricolor]